MVMSYMGSWLSGGHFNLAVTLAVKLRSLLGSRRDHFSKRQALGHVVAQLLGAFVGSWAACAALGGRETAFVPSVPSGVGIGRAFTGELVGAFFWAWRRGGATRPAAASTWGTATSASPRAWR